MLDEIQRLRDDKHLISLLEHYAQLAVPDAKAWQDRLMELAGAESKRLTHLHGELIAFDWIEQNTGCTSILKPGAVACCYRITAAGRRALQKSGEAADDEETLRRAA